MRASSTRAAIPATFLAIVLGCGEDPAPVVRPEPVLAPAPVPAPENAPAPEDAPEPASPGARRPLVLGADRSGLLVLDPAMVPLAPLRVATPDLDAIHAVAWLDGGALLAARSVREAAVWRRDGTFVGRTALPELVRAIGAPLVVALREAEETYGGAPEPADAISVGPLVRTDAGALAMDPVLGALSEEDGCPEPMPEWRVPLAVPGVVPGPTVAAELAEVPLAAPRGALPPAGWRCAFVAMEGDHAAPSWLRGLDALVGALTAGATECGDDAPADPWGRLAACHDARGVGVCRFEQDPRAFVSIVASDAMGCLAGPELFVVEGRRVVARTGPDAELRVLDGLWLFGGRAQHYAGGPGRAPLRFGRARPDVIFVP